MDSTTQRTLSATKTNSSVNAPDTNNATWFDFSDDIEGEWLASSEWNRPDSKSQSSQKGAYYQHLAEINRGRKRGRNWWNDRYFRFQINRDLTEQIARSMQLLSREVNRAKRWTATLDLGDFGRKKELVICCLCAYVLDTDKKDNRRAEPNVDAGDKSITKAELSDMCGASEDEIKSMYGKVAHKIRAAETPDTQEMDIYNIDRVSENKIPCPDTMDSVSK